MTNDSRQLDFYLLIPCYNNFPGLIRSLRTVHYDAHRYCIVVVDDGSREALSADQIISAAKTSAAVVLIRNEVNRGITDALNEGLRWIQENALAPYVARLDCGDLSAHSRFTTQVQYLDTHPNIGLLGSWCRFEKGDSDISYSYRTPTAHREIIREMHFRNVFIHPTVIFRRELLPKAGLYPTNFPFAEDYAFFWQLLKLSGGAIIDQFLVTCEINAAGISMQNRQRQLASRARVVRKYGSDPLRTLLGIARINAWRFVPKGLALRLKKR
jgi:glycosyltransferase involved in cell wall biosynthesis